MVVALSTVREPDASLELSPLRCMCPVSILCPDISEDRRPGSATPLIRFHPPPKLQLLNNWDVYSETISDYGADFALDLQIACDFLWGQNSIQFRKIGHR